MIDIGRPINLVLFFTRGMSLQGWDAVGMLSREVAIYQKLQKAGVRVSFITYGDCRDLAYAERLPGIRIYCNTWGLPQRLYEWLIPWQHRSCLRQADLYKTNQTNGADIAMRAARLWGKPLISRCGFMWSEFLTRQFGVSSPVARKGLAMEEKAFKGSRGIVVTTDEMRSGVLSRFSNLADRLFVVPNYVDTAAFRPRLRAKRLPRDICYVGRLDQAQKNLKGLVDAVSPLDVGLDVIGEGHLRTELEGLAKANSRLRLLGSIANDHLPKLLSNYRAFVLPSFYEGHPKALIEAMACGLPVITTDVPGINGIVKHGETGWLCQPNFMALREGIKIVLNDPELQQRLGENARRFVVENYSLDRVVEEEMRVYSHMLCRMPRC